MPPSDTKKKLGLKPKVVRPEKEESGSDNDHDNGENEVHVESPVEPDDHQDSADEDTRQNMTSNNEVKENTEYETMPEGDRFNGVVKWFNDRRGYGFITVVSPGKHLNLDIFVHQTHIRPCKSQYRTLVRGEYVSFFMGDADTAFDEDGEEIISNHTHQAIYVTGIEGRELLCDHSFRPNSGRSSNFKGGSNRNNSRNKDSNEEEYSDVDYNSSRREPRDTRRDTRDNQFSRRGPSGRVDTRRETGHDMRDSRREPRRNHPQNDSRESNRDKSDGSRPHYSRSDGVRHRSRDEGSWTTSH